MPFLFRFRYAEMGGHTHVRVFAGKGSLSLGKCGDLIFRNEEWAAFVAGVQRGKKADGIEFEFIPEHTT